MLVDVQKGSELRSILRSMQQIVVWEGDTARGHYQVVDALYDGRPARVLYSGDQQTAQSGVAKDGKPDLLFDYIQRLFELAIGVQPKTVLLIGGGVGTLPTALLAALPGVRIDMVEPDAGLAKLAYDYFDLPVDDRLRLFHSDGRTFLREHAGRYDMVVVDAFTHMTIPADLKTLEAFQAYHKHLARGGVLAANVIGAYYGSGAHVVAHMYAAALEVFGAAELFLASRGYSMWLPQNFILTAQKGSKYNLGDYTRGKSVSPPDTDVGIVPRD